MKFLAFPSHDIAELLDLMADQQVATPPHADWLEELNPYAVDARYGLVAASGLDRERALEVAREVIEWARNIFEASCA